MDAGGLVGGIVEVGIRGHGAVRGRGNTVGNGGGACQKEHVQICYQSPCETYISAYLAVTVTQ